MKTFLNRATAILFCLSVASVHAGLFEDEEARRAILDVRQRIETVRAESLQAETRASEDTASLKRSLLDLQNQIENLRSEVAKLRGANEQLMRDSSELQRRQKDIAQGVDERLRQFEPVKVSLDGRDFTADPAEKRDFDAALATFRKGDFVPSQSAFQDFLRKFPSTGYWTSAMFWLGNAQYATRDYKEAIVNFTALVAKDPAHLRGSEAMLSIANCQIEIKDPRAAKKTLANLIKSYPQSEAAVAAKERLIQLK